MINDIPKIDLHCHLDGSVRPETIIELAKKHNIEIPSYEKGTIMKFLVAPADCKSLVDYLKVFDIPKKVMQTEDALRRITFELYEDAAKENVKYMEVRFAPMMHTFKGLALNEVIESVVKGVKDAEEKYDIRGSIILCCMRNQSEDDAFKVIEAGREFLGKGVAAIDLCAAELDNFCDKFERAAKYAKSIGYRITIHAGETGVGINVYDAVTKLGAERIGHGVYIKDCDKAYKIVKENNITLEMCPTSNVQTKAVHSIEEHPFKKFYDNGIKVTVNTDNRTVSNTDMLKECRILFDDFKLSNDDYRKIYLNSVNAAFADDKTKEWLLTF